LLHVESFGNPRKFARTARRLARRIPLLAVDPEQAPSEARTALYAQAGIVALPSLGALVDAAALAEHQPLPRGSRVAVLGTTHGMVTLAAQACAKAGLKVTEAVNLTPAADDAALAEAVTRVLGDSPADAVFIAVAPTLPRPLDPVTAAESAGADAVVLSVLADQAESIRILRSNSGSGACLPSYNDAAAAARALAALVRAGEVMNRPRPEETVPRGADLGHARVLIDGWLRDAARGRELAVGEAAELLAAIGVTSGGTAGDPVAGERAVTLTAWQDPLFGPLLSGGAEEGRDAMTLLVPCDVRDAATLAGRLGFAPGSGLVDVVLRLAALIGACPELDMLRVRVLGGGDRPAVEPSAGAVAPPRMENPYLRRLRRAPVE